MSQERGSKYDQGKPRMDLIPPSAMLAIGRALAYGADKYDERNWEKGIKYGRLYAALQRHLLAWWAGEEEDEESGLHPLDHALCDLAMLYEMRNIHPELDDRPKTDFQIDYDGKQVSVNYDGCVHVKSNLLNESQERSKDKAEV